jgi:flagellar hook-basal body complex protein FliE
MTPFIPTIDSIGGLDRSVGASPSLAGPTSSFELSITKMLTEVDRSISAANDSVTSFAVGDAVPPHQVMLALEQARLKLQFALQVRTQLLEGFQELMRTQL